MDLNVQNTQNKVYNIPRRSYLDKGDFKEGESFCKKCGGIGQVTHDGGPINNCSQCLGRGIVDWITQAVVRPAIMTGQNASGMSSSSSSGPYGTSGLFGRGSMGQFGTSGGTNPVKPQNIFSKKVTNYKRRKIV